MSRLYGYILTKLRHTSYIFKINWVRPIKKTKTIALALI